MSDSPIVSFFATPDGTDFTTQDYMGPSNASVTPSFLPEVWKALKDVGAVPTGKTTKPTAAHMMVRVSSVASIGEWFAMYFGKPTPGQSVRLQIVGHSKSGSLSLGASWATNAAPAWAPPFWSFDSNPNALDYLTYGKIDEVMLAGCYIADRLTNTNAINGRTLLFALSELWRCKARGAVGSVNAADFDQTGWYTGGDGGPPIGWVWHPSYGARMDAEAGDSARWKTTGATLEVPDAISTASGAVTDRSVLEPVCAYFDARVEDASKPKLALPELEVTLRYGNQEQRASFVCNARFLMIARGGAEPTFYANAERRESPELADLIATLRTSPATNSRSDA